MHFFFLSFLMLYLSVTQDVLSALRDAVSKGDIKKTESLRAPTIPSAERS